MRVQAKILPLLAAASVLVLMLAHGVPAQSESTLPAWTPRTWTDIPVRMELNDAAELTSLLHTVPILSFHRHQISPNPSGGIVFTPRVTPQELADLRASGFGPQLVPDLERQGREEVERAWAAQNTNDKRTPAVFPLTTYPTHPQIGTILSDIASTHSTIARTFQWGSSVQGRELWGIVISDDVDNTEPEPEVRLSANIHGDEVVGMIMLLNFADYLTSNYGQPGFDDVTELVDDYEIHIMPQHNPDGYVAGQRWNANFIDLNRNFLAPAGTHPTRQIETTHFMDHANAHHFVLSQNGHGGALVVNYPWDYTFTRAPDDDAMIQMSLEYSTYNLPMYNGLFSQGITNGADWYVATGTLQDWSYDQTDCIDVTLEISNTKWPSTSTLLGFWNDNRESLMHYAKSARYGINGVVTNSVTGNPVDATITISGNTKAVSTDPAHGDYYKLVDTGSYTVTVSAENYTARTLFNVATTWGTPTILNVELTPDATSADPIADRPRINSVWPNPFNPRTTVRFELPRRTHAELRVFDPQGRLVRTLVHEVRAAGPHTADWDGRTDAGSPVASGVYLVRLRASGVEETVKGILLK